MLRILYVTCMFNAAFFGDVFMVLYVLVMMVVCVFKCVVHDFGMMRVCCTCLHGCVYVFGCMICVYDDCPMCV